MLVGCTWTQRPAEVALLAEASGVHRVAAAQQRKVADVPLALVAERDRDKAREVVDALPRSGRLPSAGRGGVLRTTRTSQCCTRS
eukprot:COSAG03_NODE_1295_length_4383_cov_202.981092_2_plen_85_part_00